MIRKLANYLKISHDLLEKIVKPDSLSPSNEKNIPESLEKYEDFISTHSQFSHISESQYNTLTQSLSDLPSITADLEDLESKLSLNNPLSASDQLIDALSSEVLEESSLRKLLDSINSAKKHYPPKLSSRDLMNLSTKLPQLLKISFDLKVHGISEWSQILEHIQFVSSLYFPSGFDGCSDDLFKPEDLIKVLKNSDSLEASKLINSIKNLFPSYEIPSIVFETLENTFTGLDKYEDSEILQILLAFPPGDKLDDLKVYYYKAIDNYKTIPPNDLCRLTEKMIKLNLKIPLETFNKFEKIFVSILEMNPSKRNLKYLETFIESKMFSKCGIDKICKSFVNRRVLDHQSRPIIYDIYSLLYDHDCLSLVLGKDSFYYSLCQVSSFLNTNETLKVIHGLIHHLQDLYFLTPHIEKLKKDELLEENIDKALLEKVLTEILLFNKEKPLFQYQFSSYRILEHEKLKELGWLLKTILAKLEPGSPLVFKFYNSTFSDEQPGEELVRKVLKNNAEWARYVWRMRDKLGVFEEIRSDLSKVKFKNADPEYLYFITSFSNLKLDIKMIADSDYSLAIMYNQNHTPKSFNKKINFTNLVTEAQIKTIIMLARLNDFQQLKKAVEFLSFIPATNPPVPLKVLRDLISSLSTLKKSYINYYALSYLLNSHYNIFTQPDLIEIKSLFYDRFTEILPELANKLKDLKAKEVYTSKKHLSLCKALQDQKKNDLRFENTENELERYLELRFLNKSRIISIIQHEHSKKDTQVYVKLILEILAETQMDSDVFVELMKVVDRVEIWNELDFKAQCNFFFIAQKADVKFPGTLRDGFVNSLISKAQTEATNIHPANGFKYLKPFKYNTILEPRYIVSNNIFNKTVQVDFSHEPQIPKFIVASNLKALVYINQNNLERTSEIEESVRVFYKEKNENKLFSNIKLSVYSELVKILKKIEIEENFSDPKTFWTIDFWIPSKNLAVILLGEKDFYIDENMQIKVGLLQESIKMQLEQIAKLKVLVIDYKSWRSLTSLQKKSIIQEYD